MNRKVDFDCSCGSTFILNGHLWSVISKPDKNTNEVVIVSITTKKLYSDTTVILNSEDHKFIKHDSVISYSDARLMNYDYIMMRIKARDFDPRDNFNDETVKKLQKGLLASPHTPNNIKDFFKNLNQQWI